MILLLCILFASATVAPWLVRRLGTRGFFLLAVPLAAGAVWTGSHLFSHARGNSTATRIEHFDWMPSFHLNATMRLGPLESLFGTLVLTVGVLVLVYCSGYFVNPPQGKRRRLGSFAMQMVMFAAAMYGLVVSDNMLMMFVFWEITSVLSFLLVGYYAERASSRRAAGQALMVTTLGGLVMLVGIVLMGHTTGVWTFSELTEYGFVSAEQLNSAAVGVAVVLLVVGALSKSAIAPFHFWLPGAMAAPTPVSAFLHSAAMVKAGVFLIARLSPTFSNTETWHLSIIPLGLGTMIMAGWMALRQKDLKLILAYGTVSQLGFIITVASIGTRAAMLAALALTLGHAMFKATLFMIAGAIDHTCGTRDIRRLSGLGRRQPQMYVIAVLAAASMAGVPPLFGFVAKESALDAALNAEPLHGMPSLFTTAGLVVGSILTVAYSLYLLYGAFATKPRTHSCGGGTSEAVQNMHRPCRAMLLPAWVLALAGVITGLLPTLYDALIAPYLDDTYPHAEEHTHLALWHGVTVPLVLTVVILGVGTILFWQRQLVRKLQFDKPALGSADAAYDAILAAARRLSLRVTAATQRGSLPLNEAVILLVLILLPISALLVGTRNSIRMELWDSAPQGAVALIIIIAAMAATRLANRLSGVIMVGMTGYGLALIFALYGAPDLALTQLLVETIVMVIFVLVLRTLPPLVPSNSTGWERHRAWLAIAVGLTVTVLGAFAMSSRTEETIATQIPGLALELGHGANAVNVLLVDIRAWDTFGEISVLAVAALGIASLAFRTHVVHSYSGRASRRSRRRESPRWLMSTGADSSAEKLKYPIMVMVATRILFPSMMVLAAYLFFAGHNAPGGGFAGGLVASLALALRYIIGGRKELSAAVPVSADKIVGSGLLVSAVAVLWPLLVGWPPLTSHYETISAPLIGKVSIVSPMVFDLGVFLIVIGTAVYILRSLGGRIDVEAERRAERARQRRISLTAMTKVRSATIPAPKNQTAAKNQKGTDT